VESQKIIIRKRSRAPQPAYFRAGASGADCQSRALRCYDDGVIISMVTFANQVREYAVRVYIDPARQTGAKSVQIRGDVHSTLKLTNRHPLVCAALGAMKFRRDQSLDLVGTSGPMQSPTLIYTFRLL
jgi:hypothetical protein